MGRLINPDGVGKERTRLSQSIVLALRELMRQDSADGQTRDLVAFIALALEAISETIEVSVVAWEKRGYWVKADRFRMEWAWSGRLGSAMSTAVLNDDWSAVALNAAQIAERLNAVKVPQRHRLGIPWEGAWERLLEKKTPGGNS